VKPKIIDPLRDYTNKIANKIIQIKKEHGSEAAQAFLEEFVNSWAKINGFRERNA